MFININVKNTMRAYCKLKAIAEAEAKEDVGLPAPQQQDAQRGEEAPLFSQENQEAGSEA